MLPEVYLPSEVPTDGMIQSVLPEMPSPISSCVSLFWSRLQIVDNDQVVLTSSADYTVRLWSACGEFIGGRYFASVNLLVKHY